LKKKPFYRIPDISNFVLFSPYFVYWISEVEIFIFFSWLGGLHWFILTKSLKDVEHMLLSSKRWCNLLPASKTGQFLSIFIFFFLL